MDANIEECRSWFKFICPQKWDCLARTSDFDVRFCNQCGKNVYLANSQAEFLEHKKLGRCVAVIVNRREEIGVDAAEVLGE